MVDLWPAFLMCDLLIFIFLINWFFSKPEERPKEGKSRMMQILKGAVIAIIVIYAISFLGLILLVNYFPWEGLGTG